MRSSKVLQFVESAIPWEVSVELMARRHTFVDRLSSATETSLAMPTMAGDARAEHLYATDL